MIHYHGGPITPLAVANAAWTGRHAFISFERPDQIAFAAEICQSFAIDNGAFSHWKKGHGAIDVDAYREFVGEWCRHPGFDWCLIPDVVDGDERANDAMIDRWIGVTSRLRGPVLQNSVPVWHLHESLERLCKLCRDFGRVALGSSGQWADVGTANWWQRMSEVLGAICDERGRPPCKLHGLRMLNPTVCSHVPLSSADSTNVAQNHARERQLYHLTPAMAGLKIVDRIEQHAVAPRWNGTKGVEFNMDLLG